AFLEGTYLSHRIRADNPQLHRGNLLLYQRENLSCEVQNSVHVGVVVHPSQENNDWRRAFCLRKLLEVVKVYSVRNHSAGDGCAQAVEFFQLSLASHRAAV